MNELFLIEPTKAYQEEYIDMIVEWKETGERMVPFTLRYDCSDFDVFLKEIELQKDAHSQNENFANNTTYWLVNSERRVLGAVNIRHHLTPSLLEIGGHIGYGIRPSERKKGYATKILSLALLKVKDMGIVRALVTCNKDNVGSAKTILNNGGVLDSEVIIDGAVTQRYWIDIK